MNHCRKTQDKLSFPRNYALLPLPNFGLTVCLGVKVFDVKERGKGEEIARWDRECIFQIPTEV